LDHSLDNAVYEPEIAATLKECVKCAKTLPVESFYFRDGRPDTVCKECKKEGQRLNYQSKVAKKGTEKLAAILNFLIREDIERMDRVIGRLDAFIEECEQTPPNTYNN
jgi:hypothetical protein